MTLRTKKAGPHEMEAWETLDELDEEPRGAHGLGASGLRAL